MPDEYCPIIFTQEAINRNEENVKCKAEKCAWWIIPESQLKEPPGSCAMVLIAENLMSK